MIVLCAAGFVVKKKSMPVLSVGRKRRKNMNNRQNYEEKLEVLLRLLEEMQKDQAYLMQALGNLEKIPSGSIPGDIAGQAKAAALENW